MMPQMMPRGPRGPMPAYGGRGNYPMPAYATAGQVGPLGVVFRGWLSQVVYFVF